MCQAGRYASWAAAHAGCIRCAGTRQATSTQRPAPTRGPAPTCSGPGGGPQAPQLHLLGDHGAGVLGAAHQGAQQHRQRVGACGAGRQGTAAKVGDGLVLGSCHACSSIPAGCTACWLSPMPLPPSLTGSSTRNLQQRQVAMAARCSFTGPASELRRCRCRTRTLVPTAPELLLADQRGGALAVAINSGCTAG